MKSFLLLTILVVCAISQPCGGQTMKAAGSSECPPLFQCINGQCVRRYPFDPLPPCQNILCQSNQHCVNGVCIRNVDPCTYMKIKCPPGFQCRDGGCAPIRCRRNEDCPDNFKCKFRQCIQKCSDVFCPPTHICINGQCKKKCPASSKLEKKACNEPRPTQANCPTILAKPPPPPKYCGIKANGERINFYFECEACKNTQIIYYFPTPCSSICEPNQICNGYYCSNLCQLNQVCSQGWQICISGRCLDKCVTMNCPSGQCRYGSCI